MTALVTENLPLLTGSPNGIQQLRRLILELAFRGKLTELTEGSVLAVDSARNVASAESIPVAKGRRPAPMEAVEGTGPFALPAGWRWVNFGSVAQHNSGKTLDKGRNTGQPRDYITTSNLYWGRFEMGNVRQMLIREDELDRCLARKGDLLICEGGEAGRAAVWEFDYEICFQNHIHRARFSDCVNPYFAYRFFERMNATGEINAFRKGVGISNMSSKSLASIPLPLPPIADQDRIVAKVDELMALCDRLEAEQADAEAAHAKLVEALLASLTQARDATDFRASWQQLAEHFHTLFTTEASVDALKQAVLQLGVMGKLVVQNQMEEPACKLLERLARDRRESAAELGFTDTKLSSPTQSESFLLPSGWAWTTLASLFRVITDGDHQAPPRTEHGVAFLTIGNISAGKLEFDGCRQVEPTYFEALPTYRKPARGDLLYTVVGATYGRPVLVDSDRAFCVQRHIAILKRSEHLSDRFALYLLKSPLVYKQASNCVTGTAQPTIPLKPLRNFNVPLPPLAEQHRIVAKVDELLGLCDQLKQNLATVRQSHEHLASVLVEQAVA